MQKYLLLALLALQLTNTNAQNWQVVENQKFTLHFTPQDSALIPALTSIFTGGVAQTEAFFSKPFPKHFDIWIFPDRVQLDRQWQQDWGDSTFQSACWMVASGVGKRLDMLSPRTWSTEACEHNAADTLALYQLLTHELIHVFHGQFCRTPDFTGMDDLGWWVEGLATYASGQLNAKRLERVRQLVQSGKAPEKLEQFWSGAYKYGLAGSVVAALDGRFGRAMLVQLLPMNTGAEIFGALKISETEVLSDWRKFLER